MLSRVPLITWLPGLKPPSRQLSLWWEMTETWDMQIQLYWQKWAIRSSHTWIELLINNVNNLLLSLVLLLSKIKRAEFESLFTIGWFTLQTSIKLFYQFVNTAKHALNLRYKKFETKFNRSLLSREMIIKELFLLHDEVLVIHNDQILLRQSLATLET